MTIAEIKNKASVLKEKISLDSSPVGVKFIFSENDSAPSEAERLLGHRYCQALMRARRGEHVILDGQGISCPAAAAAFGFKPLPEGLKSGKGLIGFGITREEKTGVEMFRGMTILNLGELKELYLFPLERAVIEPDIVVVEDQIEKLMWIALANLNVKGGQRVESSTAVLQATCVDATLIPYKEQKLNLSYGCYGCRDATDIGPDETVLGFPFSDFDAISGYIEYLAEKAIVKSRDKHALALIKRKAAEEASKTDVFHAEADGKKY